MRHIHKLFSAFSSSSHNETRLLRFSPGFDNFLSQNRERIRQHGENKPSYRKHAEAIAAQAEQIADAEIKSPYSGRAYAPEIDLEQKEQLNQIAIEDLVKARNDESLSAAKKEMLDECERLMDKFRTRENSKGRKVEGLVFGVDYQPPNPQTGAPAQVGVKVIAGDPDTVAAAMAYVSSQETDYDNKQRIPLVQGPGETDAEFAARKLGEQERAKNRARHNEPSRARQFNKWSTILEALRNYKSEYNMHEEIRQDIVDDSNPPERLRYYEENKPELFEQFKHERPMAYLQVLRDAAKRDPSVLEGREQEWVGTKDGTDAAQMHLFLHIIDEAKSAQPATAEFYPDRLKRIPKWITIENDRTEYIKGAAIVAGLPVYRELMKEAVAQNPDLYVRVMLPEYEQYWTQDVEADSTLGKSAQNGKELFREITLIALAQNPTLFFRNPSLRNEPYWRDVMGLQRASAFTTFVKEQTFEGKVALLRAVRSTSDVEMFYDYNGQILQFIDDVLTQGVPENYNSADSFSSETVTDKQKTVVLTVLKNPTLQQLIKRNSDSALHKKFRAIVTQTADQDMLQLLGEEFALDEASSETLLTDFLAALTKDPEGAIRKYREKLDDIPRHVLDTPKYKKSVLDLVAKKGELFAELPFDWRGDIDIIMKAVRSNASAFSHIIGEGTAGYKNDLAVIFMALEADAEGKGELDWSQVGPDAVKALKQGGIEGIPQAEQIKEMVMADPKNYLSIAIDILDKDPLTTYLSKKEVTYVMIRQHEEHIKQKIQLDSIITLLLGGKIAEPVPFEELEDASDQVLADEKIMHLSVAENGLALQYASPELQNNQTIVSAALAQNMDAFQFASDTLRASRDLTVKAVQKNGLLLEFTSPELQDAPDVVGEAMKQNVNAFQFASERIRGLREVVLPAVQKNGMLLEYAPTLQHSESVVQAAVTQNGLALQFALDLNNNEALVLSAITQNPMAYYLASDTLQSKGKIRRAAGIKPPEK